MPSSQGPHPQAAKLLLRHILKRVSRSFYLSLIILPKSVRVQVSLAYLFCRIADTIADTRLLPREERLRSLQTFREQFLQDQPSFPALEQLQQLLLPHQGSIGERQLLNHIQQCFHVFATISPADHQLIQELVLTLIQGMEIDLSLFAGETFSAVRAIPDLPTLDLYTYYVAGVVGEFWTRIHTAHVFAVSPETFHTLCHLGVRFGKGLQMTNILKDIGKDLHIGRCYLPVTSLAQVGVNVEALGHPAALKSIHSVIRSLMQDTLGHLDQAHEYIRLLPLRVFRVRLSCMWPLLFAVQTLETIFCQADALWHPETAVKISRRAVYCTIFWSLGCLVFPHLFSRYYTYLRQRTTRALNLTRVEGTV